MEITWILTIAAAILLACDWAKLFDALDTKHIPVFAIFTLGLFSPYALETLGIPIWVSVMPCYVAMMIAVIMYPKRKTTKE